MIHSLHDAVKKGIFDKEHMSHIGNDAMLRGKTEIMNTLYFF
jgi:hypothetical protein